MIVIAKKGQNKKALIGIHACLLLLSFTVVIANACQIGLIHQYATPYDAEVSDLLTFTFICSLKENCICLPNINTHETGT